jgi:hypothetical protein
MNAIEAFRLEIVREVDDRTLIRRDAEEYWVKTEFLTFEARPDDPENWQDWITESYIAI